MKKYYAFNKQSTWTILGGWIILFCLVAALDAYFITVYIAKSEIYTGILLSLFVSVPPIILTVYLYKIGLFGKYLLRFQFEQKGIRCWGLTWGRFYFSWDSVRTYGFIVGSEGYSLCPIIVFAQTPDEKWVSNLYTLRRDRLIIEYEKEKYEEMLKHLPDDMKMNLTKSVDAFKVGYYRR